MHQISESSFQALASLYNLSLMRQVTPGSWVTPHRTKERVTVDRVTVGRWSWAGWMWAELETLGRETVGQASVGRAPVWAERPGGAWLGVRGAVHLWAM